MLVFLQEGGSERNEKEVKGQTKSSERRKGHILFSLFSIISSVSVSLICFHLRLCPLSLSADVYFTCSGAPAFLFVIILFLSRFSDESSLSAVSHSFVSFRRCVHDVQRPRSDHASAVAVLTLAPSLFLYLVPLPARLPFFSFFSYSLTHTQGDVYMTCSGAPAPRSDHASAMAALALDMRDIVSGFDFNQQPSSSSSSSSSSSLTSASAYSSSSSFSSPSSSPSSSSSSSKTTKFEFQIGMNSGGIIAGVVGVKYPRFRLMGDTVNVCDERAR